MSLAYIYIAGKSRISLAITRIMNSNIGMDMASRKNITSPVRAVVIMSIIL